MGLRNGTPPSNGDNQLPGLEPQGRDVRVYNHERSCVEDSGRVGDSPIIGAGLYVDQEVGAAGSTGRGEENIRVAGAHTVVENMRHGMTPREACLDVLKRIARNYNNDLKRLEKFDINFYALRKDGQFAGSSLWNAVRSRGAWVSRQFAVTDGGKARLENCVYLLERKA